MPTSKASAAKARRRAIATSRSAASPRQEAMPQQPASAHNPSNQRSKLFRYASIAAGVASAAGLISRSMQGPQLIVARAELDRCPLTSEKNTVRAYAMMSPNVDVLCLDKAGANEVYGRPKANCFSYARSDYSTVKFEHPMNVFSEDLTCKDLNEGLTGNHQWNKKTSAKDCSDGKTHVRSYLSKPGERKDYHFVVNPDSKDAMHKPGSLGVDALNKSYVEPDGSLARKETLILTDDGVNHLRGIAYDVCDDYCVEREEAPKV